MSNPKLKEMFADIEQQVKKSRARVLRLSSLTGITFFVFTAIFLSFVPEFLTSIGLLLLAVIIMLLFTQSSPDPDNNDGDGGWDQMWFRNCLVMSVVLVVGFFGLALFVLTFLTTVLSKYIEMGLYVTACIVIFYVQYRITKQASDGMDPTEEECWVCATDCHKDGEFSCPICGFSSGARNPYRGLCAHMNNMHHEVWRNTPLFKRLCASCKTNRYIKIYLSSKGASRYGP